jgi:N-acetylmuramoyl-L-alanine amidase CwlA
MSLDIKTTYKAKTVSYDSSKTRDLKSIKYIVIHYTGNKGDKAASNARYFAETNTRTAGAHFFVDKSGECYKSIDMNRIAWAVGGDQRSGDGGGKLYGVCTNTNSVSIELCDCLSDTNYTQLLTTRQLVEYIQEKCPNATTIVRHWDVNGKQCPACMTGSSNAKWTKTKDFCRGTYSFTAKVTEDLAIRSSAKVTDDNKIGSLKVGDKIKVTAEKGNWGKVSYKGKTGYISLNKIKFA